jgi:membrane protein DedA with SNARE-associated domain
MAGVNLIAFILISALGRGVRFFIVAYLIKFFGNPAIILLKNNMLLASTILGIAIIMISFYIF